MPGTRRTPDPLRLTGPVLVLCLAACSGSKPILYPNAHFQTVGAEAAEQDITECRKMAEEAGATPDKGKSTQVAGSTAVGAGIGTAAGAVGGAIVGAAGTGAAIGAASGATWSLLSAFFRSSQPSQAHQRFVDICLKKRGYEPVGWK